MTPTVLPSAAAPPPTEPRLTLSVRQRWLLATPNISLVLFMVAIGAFLWGLHKHDVEQRRSSLIEDVLWEDQTIRLHFQSTEDMLTLLAKELSEEVLSEPAFQARASLYVRNNPELVNVASLDTRGMVRWTAPHATTGSLVGHRLRPGPSEEAFRRAQLMGRTAYSAPYRDANGVIRIDVYVPVYRQSRLYGTVSASYTAQGILQHLVPWWFAQKYQLSIVDSSGDILASKLALAAHDTDLTYQLNFDPPGHGLMLRATSYQNDSRIAQNMLAALIVGLSALIIWSLWALRRHMQRRLKAEEALRSEHAFRKAMEDSMLTGLRAIDMDGTITYVNQAFCHMVGWAPEELIGCRAPMPYWAPEAAEAAAAAYRATLEGRAPATGFELRFRRKNGERFDSLLFISPLIDAEGRQTGWMASMNDITERHRAREALRASHERFVAVLDGLDAAVSVADTETHELLYVNEQFKQVFGLDTTGERRCHITHAWQAQGAPLWGVETVFDAETRDPASGRWYHVRSRAIKWVDGRTVLMEVSTDITQRKQAEELARQQAEKVQINSRLITMGEMASTLAHELNQPLSAIASYNTGCMNRLQTESLNRDDLLGALEKIGTQARRAGKIISRIREFVRRREPRRARCDLTDIIEEAVAFAEIEARKRSTDIELRIEPGLPVLHVDRIMIEQVLLNLLNNAVEAMHDTPPPRRRVIVAASTSGTDAVEVAVHDRGTGIAPEAAEKLFSPFFTTKQEGMGMGLNICRSIIEFHRGRLWMEPNPEGGAVFRFRLPIE